MMVIELSGRDMLCVLLVRSILGKFELCLLLRQHACMTSREASAATAFRMAGSDGLRR